MRVEALDKKVTACGGSPLGISKEILKPKKRKKPFRHWRLKIKKSPKKRTSNKPLKHLILRGNGKENKNTETSRKACK